MDGSGDVRLPAGAQDAVGSGGRASSSSASAAWSFDFTLTGPMWWEFAMASNAYGRGLRHIYVPGSVFVVVLLLVVFLSNGTLYFPNDEWWVYFLVGLTVLALLCCGGPLARWGVANKLAAFASEWFAVPSTSTADIWRILGQRSDGSFDSRWNTPCRLTVDADGVVLERWVRGAHAREGSAGRRRVVRASWSQLDCVRLTEHAVVLSPSAGGKASIDIIPAVADVKLADLDCCVLVDRSVVPDVEGFVAWCRDRIAGASPRPEAGWRLWLYRFRRWLYGDDEFLDGPSKGMDPWMVTVSLFVVVVPGFWFLVERDW
ncbi:hypothetical protein OZX74_06685 [Bifidobacterium sp. ESL0798]|uniref:hypothetical protein n=1 Tax=Bifidobacterium sp. ESL0798 TaxID=2983235 RepID=UPI0023F9BF02|nr:hypothetical protein [Bifidobacterium sp. ESL0798]WEV73597.1 hypothetical protein OZX74_06685 [Bifidobacterium sp. ESL0798]